jgi:hypothetical protein
LTDHSQLLLRTNHSKRLKIFSSTFGQQQQLLDLRDESVGGHDVGETKVPNRVEDSSSKEGHVFCRNQDDHGQSLNTTTSTQRN